jgi:hypothetical protein
MYLCDTCRSYWLRVEFQEEIRWNLAIVVFPKHVTDSFIIYKWSFVLEVDDD